MQKLFKLFLYTGIVLWWGGCTSVPSHQQRLQVADQLATEQGWQRHDLDTSPFVLITYLPEQSLTKNTATDHTLTVYIEGDGLAWVSKSRASKDPTPIDPIGLRLALQHPDGQAAYLARPCQFTDADENKNCDVKFWTSARFSPEVITASNKAISTIMEMTSSTSVRLVGYSGGGAVAALVAARRDDVSLLITVAGNLDHRAWTKQHRISPLKESLNPADASQQLKDTPQIHLVGGKDKIVGNDIFAAYSKRFPSGRQPKTIHFQSFTHQCCWADNWREIYLQISNQDEYL